MFSSFLGYLCRISTFYILVSYSGYSPINSRYFLNSWKNNEIEDGGFKMANVMTSSPCRASRGLLLTYVLLQWKPKWEIPANPLSRGRFFFLCPNYCYLMLVPSRAPSNVIFTNVGSTEVTVNWDPLPGQYVNGRLLGYKVYFQETASYSVSYKNSVNVTTNSTRVTMTGLKPGQRYYTYISAFTSKGEGPRSYFYYITTGRYLKRQAG